MSGETIRVAYADPPYLGTSNFGAAHHYGDLHPDAALYDTLDGHRALIGRLQLEFPDGWALSLHAPSLRHVLPLCPDDCRIGAWVKPFAFFKPGVNPAYAWEPVIWRGGRKRGRKMAAMRDWCDVSVKLRGGIVGAKPDNFCFWVFLLLGLLPGDEFVDIFPGSGAVGRAWERWQRRERGLFARQQE